MQKNNNNAKTRLYTGVRLPAHAAGQSQHGLRGHITVRAIAHNICSEVTLKSVQSGELRAASVHQGSDCVSVI
jgi:hypothetical protein